MMVTSKSKIGNDKVLKASWLDTLLGLMLAIADEQALYFLEFVNRRESEREVERLCHKTQSTIIAGCTTSIRTIENQLKLYFESKINRFKTPLHLIGSSFQKQVCEELQKIPPGETRSYSDIARAVVSVKSNRFCVFFISCIDSFGDKVFITTRNYTRKKNTQTV